MPGGCRRLSFQRGSGKVMDSSRRLRQSEHRDVILLPELPGRSGNRVCGLVADCPGALKSVEFTLWACGFNHTVGHQGAQLIGVEPERNRGVMGARIEAEGQ